MPDPIVITSPQNSRLKQAVRLRERRGRRQQGRTIIDGRREVLQALNSNWLVDELYARKSLLESGQADAVLAELTERSQLLVVNDDVFAKLTFGDRDEGVIATAILPDFDLDLLALPPNPLVCVLDQIEKPGNIGAVLRTLDGAGVDGLILSDPQTDAVNPNAIRASLGAIFRIPIGVDNSNAVMQWLQDRGIRVLAARVEDGASYDADLYQGSVAIVLGGEAKGLNKRWAGERIQNVAVPMHGRVDSLNVSAAAAVLAYEAVRQRSK